MIVEKYSQNGVEKDSCAGQHREPLNKLLGEDPGLGLPEMIVILSKRRKLSSRILEHPCRGLCLMLLVLRDAA